MKQTKKTERRNKGDLKGKEDLSKAIRIPRPLGLTLNLIATRKKGEDLEEVRRIVIEQWSSAGMVLNEKVYTVEQMASYLATDPDYVMDMMWKSMRKMGKLMDYKDVGETARDLFSWTFKKILEIGAQNQSQVAILMRAQGDKYVPFLSSALNQALGNLNATQAPILSLLKTLTDKQETNIFNIQNGPTTTNQYITSNEAMKYVEEMRKELSIESSIVSQLPDIKALPDINPNTQDLALITKPKFLNPLTNPSNPMPHSERRQVKEKVWDSVEDEEDFIS